VLKHCGSMTTDFLYLLVLQNKPYQNHARNFKRNLDKITVTVATNMLKYVDRKFSEKFNGKNINNRTWNKNCPNGGKVFRQIRTIHYLHQLTIQLDLYFQRCIKFLPMRNKKFPWMLFFARSTTSQTSLTQNLFPIDILHIHNWILKLYVNRSYFSCGKEWYTL